MLDHSGIQVVDQYNLVPDLLTLRDQLASKYGMLIIIREEDRGYVTINFLDSPLIDEKTDGAIFIQSRCDMDRSYCIVTPRSARAKKSLRCMNHLWLSTKRALTVGRLVQSIFPIQIEDRYMFVPSGAYINPAFGLIAGQVSHLFHPKVSNTICWTHVIDYLYSDLTGGGIAFGYNRSLRFMI